MPGNLPGIDAMLSPDAFDKEGFLRHLQDWNAEVAQQIANAENIVLIYLMSLFPGSPAKLGSKIAGLPKPENCL